MSTRIIKHKLNQIMEIQDDIEQLYAFYSLVQDTQNEFGITDNIPARTIVFSKQGNSLLKKHADIVLKTDGDFGKIRKAYEENNKGH